MKSTLPRRFPNWVLSLATALVAVLATHSAGAGTHVQSTGASHVAFSATTATLTKGTPENWGLSNVVGAGGHVALYARGNNSTADSPHSFAQYSIQFRTAGTYRLYYRWKADESRTAGDNATANSSWLGATFGAFSTPGDPSPFYRSDSNNSMAPANNAFAWRKEPTATYAVGPAEVAAPVVFTVGTREAGMMIDRLVFSTEDGLADAQLDALSGSLAQVVQGQGEPHLAWSADGPVTLFRGAPESWVSSNVVNAVGGTALYASGNNSTADSPHSFAQFQLVFRTAGTYSIFYRWKADESRTAGDNATANSSWLGSAFGAFETPGDPSTYFRTDSNNSSAPANNTFAWRAEPTATYTVAASDVGNPVVLTLGTREAGMTIDRFVLSQDSTLTGPQLDALPDSGTKPPAPEVASVVGSAALNQATLVFTRPLASASVQPGRFVFTPALAVTSTTLDPGDARILRLTTATQAQGTRYTITISDVTDTAGTAIKPASQTAFTSWKQASGWATREMWLGVPGNTLADLSNSAVYPDKPDRVQFVRGFDIPRSGAFLDMITRVTAWYTPATSGAFDLLVNNDDEAEIFLSTDATEANLSSLGQLLLHAPPFADGSGVTTPPLVSGRRYLLRGVLKQGGGDAYLSVAARPSGAFEPPAENLAPLSGAAISTMVNPDLGLVTFDAQPASVTVASGGRARFSVKAKALASPVYYQWRCNGSPIPGATRPVFTTPVLTTGDNNAAYDVVVSVAGTDTTSAPATLTVTPGEPGPLQPYVGVNFTGGGYVSEDSVALAARDVAGVVPQENWNNTGSTLGPVPLNDAAGNPSPVSLTISTPGGANAGQWSSGSRFQGDADGDLMQGFVMFGTGTEPVSFTFDSVPAGSYQVIAYTLGFDFQADYKESFAVVGAAASPTYYAQGETGIDYGLAPAFRRVTNTNPATWQKGNYVQFDNVRPAADGTLTLVVQWQGTGGSYYPAVNGIQLVRVNPVVERPTLAVTRGAASLNLSWGAAASGYTLESASDLGSGASWTPVPGLASPLPGAGGLDVTASAAGRYYRLIKR
jgi:hypothetical protein